MPLYAALPPDEQLRAFQPAAPGERKVILATNIAETSVTIGGVRFVVDPGLVKMRGYSAKTGVESLVVTAVSQVLTPGVWNAVTPKADTNCTAQSLMPTIIGYTFAASLRTDICPQRKEARPRLTLGIRLILTFLIRLSV